MKKYALLFCSIVILIITGCKYDPKRYVEKVTKFNLEDCTLESNNDYHGFFGDGNRLIVFKCDDKVNPQDLKWKSLPLKEELEELINGTDKDEFKLPKINNGYYKFINRNKEAANKEDEDIFNKHSFNFSIAIYDTDNNELYFYELDT